MNLSDIYSTMAHDEQWADEDGGPVIRKGGKITKGKLKDGAPIKLKDGTLLTKEMYEHSSRNGMDFNDMNSMADWMNGWSRPVKSDFKISPYYRVYPEGKISGADVQMIYSKYKDDPKVMEVLKRNTAGNGEVPQYGPEDADIIRKITQSIGNDPMFAPVPKQQ